METFLKEIDNLIENNFSVFVLLLILVSAIISLMLTLVMLAVGVSGVKLLFVGSISFIIILFTSGVWTNQLITAAKEKIPQIYSKDSGASGKETLYLDNGQNDGWSKISGKSLSTNIVSKKNTQLENSISEIRSQVSNSGHLPNNSTTQLRNSFSDKMKPYNLETLSEDLKPELLKSVSLLAIHLAELSATFKDRIGKLDSRIIAETVTSSSSGADVLSIQRVITGVDRHLDMLISYLEEEAKYSVFDLNKILASNIQIPNDSIHSLIGSEPIEPIRPEVLFGIVDKSISQIEGHVYKRAVSY